MLSILFLFGICAGHGMSQLIYPDQYEVMRKTSPGLSYTFTDGSQSPTYPSASAPPGAPRSVENSQTLPPPAQGIPTFIPTLSPLPPASILPPRQNVPVSQGPAGSKQYPPPPRAPVQNSVVAYSSPSSQNVDIYEAIYKGVMKFALNLNNAVARSERDPEDNIVFSPLNIATALAMVLLGSAGRTFDETAKLLGFDAAKTDVSNNSELFHEMFGLLLSTITNKNPQSGAPQVQVANGLFVQEGHPIRPEYLTYVQNIYNSDVSNLDFQSKPKEAQDAVNAWVNTHTMGKIPRILDAPRPDVHIILASALYFKGEWNQHFLNGATRRRPFFIEADKTVDVDMMYNGGEFSFYEDQQIGAKILALPYKQLDYSMYLVLPKAKGAAALKEFTSRLTSENLEYMIGNMRRHTCIFGMPRMKLSSSVSLAKTLQTLNLRSVFDPLTADLSVLSPGRGESIGPVTTRSIPKIGQYPDIVPTRSPIQTPAQSPTKPKSNNNRPTRPTLDNDIIVFPRLGTDDDDETSSNEKMKNYFMYEDKYGGYSVEQWATGFLIKRLQRIARKNNEADLIDESDDDLNANIDKVFLQNRNFIKDNGKENSQETRTRSKRQTRQDDFIRYIESQNLTTYGLDSFRNFNRLSNPHLYADEVLHKVEIEITETGTEAAASTSVLLERDGSQKRLIGNRPFLFFIRHEPSKMMLFWGTINTPTPHFPSG